jgi:mannosyltransferase OCH1-like enzyme
MDSAYYTFEHCPAWAMPCHPPTVEIGMDLSTPAVASFCEQVMVLKEAAERERERSSYPKRTAGRRWNY